jgi:hypothetical protein
MRLAFPLVCVRCEKPVRGQYIIADGAFWHLNCYEEEQDEKERLARELQRQLEEMEAFADE